MPDAKPRVEKRSGVPVGESLLIAIAPFADAFAAGPDVQGEVPVGVQKSHTHRLFKECRMVPMR
eukprot:4146141-Pyramimonas_sp.AAC.1